MEEKELIFRGTNISAGVPYVVTKGNKTITEGDVVAISPRDGALIICPKVSAAKTEQGGWFDADELKNFPEILDFEAVIATDRYMFESSERRESINRRPALK